MITVVYGNSKYASAYITEPGFETSLEAVCRNIGRRYNRTNKTWDVPISNFYNLKKFSSIKGIIHIDEKVERAFQEYISWRNSQSKIQKNFDTVFDPVSYTHLTLPTTPYV